MFLLVDICGVWGWKPMLERYKKWEAVQNKYPDFQENPHLRKVYIREIMEIDMSLLYAASCCLITNNSMASWFPSHNKYVFRMPPNILCNPRDTDSTLLPIWQQTYTSSASYNAVAAHTPLHRTRINNYWPRLTLESALHLYLLEASESAMLHLDKHSIVE